MHSYHCHSFLIPALQIRRSNMIMSAMQYSLLISLLFPFLLFLILFKKTKQKPNHLPPSPFKLPIIGNLHQLRRLPHRSLHALSLKYGPLMFLKLGHSPAIVVSSADLAREIFKNRDLSFSSRPRTLIAEQLLYGKDVAFAPYGDYWKQAKRVCVLHLLSSKQVELLRPAREEEIAIAIHKIRSSAAMIEGAMNLSETIVCITNNVASRAALGKKYVVGGEENNGKEIRRLMEEFVQLLGGFHVGDFFPWLGWISRFNGMDLKINKNFKEWDDLLTKIIKDHDHESGKREEDEHGHEGVKDFIDVLLQLQKDGSAGIPLTHDHIKAIAMDMFAGGTGSSYSVIEWAMAELMRHPKAMHKLQEEVRGVASGQANVVTEDIIHQMKYLKCVIKECLRMHPPVPLVPRESIQAVEINGYLIPAKTWVFINAWAIGRDPKSWESPDEFQPERFLSRCSHVDFKGHDYELLPFGAGRRGCPGIHFAITTVELVLANLVYHFNWEMPSGMSSEDLDMTESSGLTVHKKKALLLVPKDVWLH